MPIDAAIVLGAAVNRDGSPGEALVHWVAAGAALVSGGQAQCLLLTGGPVRHPRPEAEVMRDAALAQGLPPEALVLEPEARNTLENALFSRRIVIERGWRRVAVISDDFHLPRALYTFRRLGLPATGIAAPRTPRRAWWLAAWVREAAAFAVYVPRVERRRRALRPRP